MKFKLFHFVTLLFIPIISFAQTHFVDSNDMVPIPFVHVISVMKELKKVDGGFIPAFILAE